MYGFTLANHGGQQTIQCGLNAAQPIVDLAAAFELVRAELAAIDSALAAGAVNPEWGALRVVADTSTELRLSADRDEFLLHIADADTGSDTTTGASTLADAFAFAAYWAMANFE